MSACELGHVLVQVLPAEFVINPWFMFRYRPRCLSWACKRAGHDVEYFARRIPQLTSWIQQEKQPTLNQLEKLARVTHTPFGYLFLPEPPHEPLPVPDYRTVSGSSRHRPSPNLLETIYAMQRRQDWLRESLIGDGIQPLDFVACARLSDEPEAVGHGMRVHLAWVMGGRRKFPLGRPP